MRSRGSCTAIGPRAIGQYGLYLLLVGLVALQAACTSAAQTPAPTSAPALATSLPPPPTATVVPPTPVPAKPIATAVPKPTASPAPPAPRPTNTLVPKRMAPPAEGQSARVLAEGNAASGCAALTFDMGEKAPGGTPAVLDALKQNGTHATFLLTGQWAEANPELVKRMVAEGHELGNHSYDHPDFTQIGEAEMLRQIDRTEASVQRIVGASLRPYFRPPFGAYNDRVRSVVARRGYHILYWSLDSADWRNEMTADDVVNRVVGKTAAGDLVVFHGYAEKTAKAIPSVLARLKAKGLCLRTVSEVLQ